MLKGGASSGAYRNMAQLLSSMEQELTRIRTEEQNDVAGYQDLVRRIAQLRTDIMSRSSITDPAQYRQFGGRVYVEQQGILNDLGKLIGIKRKAMLDLEELTKYARGERAYASAIVNRGA
jgi:hypothetical protein